MFFEALAVGVANPSDFLSACIGRCRKIGAERKEIVLNFTEDGINGSVRGKGPAGTDEAVQLVQRAIGLDPEVVFRYASPSEQGRFAGISGLGVNFQCRSFRRCREIRITSSCRTS